jgi:hypothetical protein
MIYRTALPLPGAPKMVLREIPSSTTYTTNDCCRDSIQHFFRVLIAGRSSYLADAWFRREVATPANFNR